MPARDAKQGLNRLTRRRRFLSMRMAARTIVDALRFGRGSVERIGAACVLSAVFFFAVALATHLAGMPTALGVTVAVGAFAAAATTLLVFVLGQADDDTRAEIDALAEPIAEARADVERDEREAAGRKRLEDDDDQDDDQGDEKDEGDRRDRRAPRRDRPSEPGRNEPRDRRREDRPSRGRPQARCPYCRDDIDRDAVKCPSCGEWVDDAYRPKPPKAKRGVSRGIAALLSFLLVGAGQIAQGRVLAGVMWMFSVLILYAFSPCSFFTTTIVGIILHVVCILDAAAHE